MISSGLIPKINVQMTMIPPFMIRLTLVRLQNYRFILMGQESTISLVHTSNMYHFLRINSKWPHLFIMGRKKYLRKLKDHLLLLQSQSSSFLMNKHTLLQLLTMIFTFLQWHGMKIKNNTLFGVLIYMILLLIRLSAKNGSIISVRHCLLCTNKTYGIY